MAPKDFDPALDANTTLDTTSFAFPKTDTGLDRLIEIAIIDPGLNLHVDHDEIEAGAAAGAAMNAIIIEGIKATGIANDGAFRAADIYVLADWIASNKRADWIKHHGNDEKGVETGFHLIQSDGDVLNLFGDAGVDQVADGIYHQGFGTKDQNLINEDGQNNVEVEKVAYWMNALLSEDLNAGTLANSAVEKYVMPSTGTGLDHLVEIVLTDEGLGRRISLEDINAGAAAADAMNVMILDGIKALGIANNGSFTASDMRDLSDWIAANRFAEFKAAHGDDEKNIETGFHLVQGDGSEGRLFAQNAVNTVADGIYHLGFGYKWGHLRNEDGDGNASLESVAHWLEKLLESELNDGSLTNADADLYPVGTTGTALDEIVAKITNDPGFTDDFKSSELAQIARDTDKLNAIVLEAIRESDVARDGTISELDIAVIGAWINDNRLSEWSALRGDKDTDKGVVGLEWDGGSSQTAGVNTFNAFAPALYSLGYSQKWGGIRDEDGDWSGTTAELAAWLSHMLADELADGTLTNAPQSVDMAAVEAAIVVEANAVNVTDRENAIEIDHSNALRLEEGTVALTFITDDVNKSGSQVLFAKDHNSANSGDMHVYMYEGELWVRTPQDGNNKYYKIPVELESQTAYDLAITFGDQGLGAWVNGALVMFHESVRTDWRSNTNDLIVGATNASQKSTTEAKLNSYFEGEILDFTVYARALDRAEIAAISGGATRSGDHGNNDIAGTSGNDALLGGLGKDILVGGDGDDGLYGGYGSDRLSGGTGSDLLDGGHGRDVLDGGEGDDIILSKSDAREPVVAQLYKGVNGIPEDESGFAAGGGTGPCPVTGGAMCNCGSREANGNEDPQNELDRETGKLYPDQPIPADDVLTGGAGADIFRFETLINAKRKIIEKHTRDDGSINWGGVAGENDRYHDHWVDAIGDDLITDFNRTEGDKIEIAGHTTRIAAITYEDSDGDGVDDQSVIHLISDQGGNGGAHDQDVLGTITVEGDLLQKGDISVDSKVVYGIVENIRDIDEAITPLEVDETGARGANAALAAQAAQSTDREAAQMLPGDDDPVEVETYTAPTDIPATGTGLDTIVQWIITDPGIINRTTQDEISQGAKAAAAMNAIVVDAIKQTGAANDGLINSHDVYLINGWIASNRKADWIKHHGDDEKSYETGFHKVQGDGGKLVEFGRNAVDTIADGIYHLGFDIRKGRLANEDGNSNARVEEVAYWLNTLLQNDMAALAGAPAATDVQGSTGTGLDALVDVIRDDPGLLTNISAQDMIDGAKAADTMNKIIVQSIQATGIANNDAISIADIRTLADHIKSHYYGAWKQAHGDDEKNIETGFHLVQGDGGDARMFGKSAVNTIADGLYHLGFGVKNGRLLNEDGQGNASLSDVAFWLENLLEDDLQSGGLRNPLVSLYHMGQTGTGLDALVTLITQDEGLKREMTSGKINEAAKAADGLNAILIEGIKATGIANNGTLTAQDLIELDAWIGDNRLAELKLLNGTKTSNFGLADTWSARSPLFGEHGTATVMDALYSLGFGVLYGDSIANENGKWEEHLSRMADWMNALLKNDLAAGALYSSAFAIADPLSFQNAALGKTAEDVTPDGTGSWLNIEHTPDMALSEGTLTMSFTADTIPTDDSVTLFSKDARDFGSGGHTTVYIAEGILWARVQSTNKSYHLRAEMTDFIRAGTQYQLAAIFGDKGFHLYLDGEKVISEPDLTINWTNNRNDLVVGGHSGWRNDKHPEFVFDVFDGTIADFTIYDRALHKGEVAGLAGLQTDVLPGSHVPEVAPPPVVEVPATEEVPVAQTPDAAPQEPEDAPEEPMEPEATDIIDAQEETEPPQQDQQVEDDPVETPQVAQTPQTEETDPAPQPEQTPAQEGMDGDIGDLTALDAPADVSMTTGQVVFLGATDDHRTGSASADMMIATAGANALEGGGGNDYIVGGIQSDELDGGIGDDIIIGDIIGGFLAGGDDITGGQGNDTLMGGRGADKYRFTPGDGSDVIGSFDQRDIGNPNTGVYTITIDRADFTPGLDKIVLQGFQTLTQNGILSSGAISQSKDGVVFSAEGTTVLLHGVDRSELSETDFTFG